MCRVCVDIVSLSSVLPEFNSPKIIRDQASDIINQCCYRAFVQVNLNYVAILF